MKFHPGVPAALGSAVLFGLTVPFARQLLGDVSPLMLAGLLYLGSGVGLALLLGLRAATRRGRAIVWPRRWDLGWLLVTIVVGGALGPYLLMWGLQRTDAASASLILNLESVFTALLAWVVFRENVDRRIAAGMALIVIGALVLSIAPSQGPRSLVGGLAIAGACMAWGVDNNLTRKVSLNDGMVIACAKGLVAGNASIAIAHWYGAPLPGTPVALHALALGFAGYGLSLTLFVIGLRQLGAARTGAYFSVAPFIGAAFALALGAPWTLALGLAGATMAAGLWLHLSEHHEHPHRHEGVQHEHAHVHDAHHAHEHASGEPGPEPHVHRHDHESLEHVHEHFPDTHHRHHH